MYKCHFESLENLNRKHRDQHQDVTSKTDNKVFRSFVSNYVRTVSLARMARCTMLPVGLSRVAVKVSHVRHVVRAFVMQCLLRAGVGVDPECEQLHSLQPLDTTVLGVFDVPLY